MYGTYEFIQEAYVQDGILNFTSTYHRNYNPMTITVVNFASLEENKRYYLTKGMKERCVLYIEPLNEEKSEFCIAQHLCE